MKQKIGILLMVLSIVLGCYLGIWVMFVGGVIEIVKGFTGISVNGIDIGIGLLRMLFASVIGWFSFVIVGVTGFTLYTSK